jgi:hypothetical protein
MSQKPSGRNERDAEDGSSFVLMGGRKASGTAASWREEGQDSSKARVVIQKSRCCETYPLAKARKGVGRRRKARRSQISSSRTIRSNLNE